MTKVQYAQSFVIKRVLPLISSREGARGFGRESKGRPAPGVDGPSAAVGVSIEESERQAASLVARSRTPGVVLGSSTIFISCQS